MRKIYIISALFLGLSFNLSAQNWIKTSPDNISITGQRDIKPEKSKLINVDFEELKTELNKAPLGYEAKNKLEIVIPTPNGSKTFKIAETPVLSSEIQATRNDIKTFTGFNVAKKSEWIKLDYTSSGFHAMILSTEGGGIFIDPYQRNDVNNYNVYYKRDLINNKEFTCWLDDSEEAINENAMPVANRVAEGDCRLRTYRLALAANAEYTAYHGGVVNAQSAMVTTMNRVNGLTERDLGVTMNIISGTILIFTNTNTDGYTNNNGSAMLNENKTNCNNLIGSANYDIGHVFSTGGGGIAQLYSPCGNNKARGVTGSGNPIGDPFDVDYVAHEMGHQYGGNHSFNSTNSSCGTRNGSTAYEPGSGTSIQAYAGICGVSNVQNNSDAFYHSISIAEMSAFLTDPFGGSSCPTFTSSGNNAPNVSAGGNYTIPRSTPFELTASATDADGDAVTYAWEQFDLGNSQNQPSSTSTTQPNFRSFLPDNSPTRVFPQLSNILAGNNTTQWETISTVSRDLDFRVTARDNNNGGYGCTDSDNMTVTVSANSGPFLVTAPNTALTWTVGNAATITWDVANTTGAPVFASFVDIFLSTDGGNTFPITLASNVTNSGTRTITVPNNITTQARIKVKGRNNVFFDISNSNFTISNGGPVLTFDDCSGAITVGCGSTTSGTTVGATVDVPPAGSCGAGGNTAPGVWYKFVGNGDAVNASTCGAATYDTRISVYSGTCGTLTCVAGNDDGTGCAGFTSEVNFNTVNGTDYFILVHGYDIEEGDFDLTISCTPPCTPIPSNDNCASAQNLSISNLGSCSYVTGTNECATAAIANPTCDAFGVIQDVWYTFNTGSDTGITFNINNLTSTAISFALYDACGGNQVFCNENATNADISQTLNGFPTSTTYLLQVWNGGGAEEGTFEICLEKTCASPAIPTISAGGPTTFCTGNNVILTSSSATGNQWYLNGTPIGGATNQNYTANTAGNYAVEVSNGCGSESSGATTITINTPPATPTISAGGPTTFCSGGNVTLTSSSSTANQWYLDGGIIGGATNQTYSANASGNYTVRVTNGCGFTNSLGTTVTVNTCLANDVCSGAITVACGSTTSGSTTGASTDSTELSSSCGAGGYSAPGVWYRFVGNGDAVNVSTCGAATYDTRLSVYSGSCGVLTCVAGNDDGTGCAGFTSELNFNSTNGTDYFIFVHGYNNNVGDFDLTITCTPPCAPIPSNDDCAGAQSLTVFGAGLCTAVTGTNECAAAAIANPTCDQFGVIQDVWYTFNSGANASIDLSVIKGTATDIEVAVYESCGGTQVGCFNGDAATDISQTLTALIANNDYYIQVWNGGGAEEGTFDICLEGNCPTPAVPTITAGGSTTICSGSSVTLTSSSATANQWYLDGNLIGGATNQTYSANAAGDYTVRVTNGCGFTNSLGTSVTVNTVPATPTITAGGSTTFCSGSSVTLTSSSATANQWYLDGNIIGGATNQTYSANVAGSYTVRVTNGCGFTNSLGTLVTVNTVPAVPTITAGGSTTFCSGSSVTLTSSSATANQWYLDGNLISGATNQTYSANVAGSYTVRVTNGCGFTNSLGTTVTVNTVPATPTITAGGATSFCTGGNVMLTSSSATANQWYLDGNIIGGATNQSYSANATGSYTVEVTNGCGSTGSLGTSVTVNVVPTTPIITAGGPTTFCDGDSVILSSSSSVDNQWYLNGNIIIGATNQNYTATMSGDYTVDVSNICGASSSLLTNVVVNTLPAISYSGLNSTYCLNSEEDTLIGMPAGGMFTGNGINGNVFNSSNAGLGTQIITYSYTDGNGCSNSIIDSTVVNDIPLVSISGIGQSYCDTDGDVTLTVNPAGGTLSGNGISGLDFSPSNAGVGSHTVIYNYIDMLTGCDNSDTIVVNVTSAGAPVASFTNSITDLDVAFTNSSTNSGEWFWDFGDGDTSSVENPNHSYTGNGTYTVCLKVWNGCGIADSICNDVVIDTTTGPGPQPGSIEDVYNNAISIYPNPTTNTLNLDITLLNAEDVNYEMVDVLGQLININNNFNQEEIKEQIDVSNLQSGVYFMKIQIAEIQIIRKVIIKD